MFPIDNYIFKLSDKVTRQSVSYNNRYGIKIAADLYLPQEFDESKKHPALIVGAPYGGVKEQGPGIYAQNMAERGFVALTFTHLTMDTAAESPGTFLHRIYL